MIPARFLPLIVLLPAPAWAQEAPAGVAGSLAQMVLGLGVVIALLLATLWLIKRLSVPRGAAAGLKVLCGVAVGARERVVLVELGDQVLVLGVTPGSVRTLHVLPASELSAWIREAAPSPAAAPGDFAGWLRRSLERRNDGR